MNIKNKLWTLVAWVVSWPPLAERIINRSFKHPYRHLPGYMDRFWVFNPYNEDTHQKASEKLLGRLGSYIPSVRVHHILRPDLARHLHDHPWNARTIILKGRYSERKLYSTVLDEESQYREWYKYNYREVGDTATINHGDYHSIDDVSEGGVWTLFITYKYMGMWGFLVDGVKIPWREYEQKYPT